jgi:hypothetical protein
MRIFCSLAFLFIQTAWAICAPALDGSSRATQNAIDRSPPGAGVDLPPGSFNWIQGIRITKPIHLRGRDTVIVNSSSSQEGILNLSNSRSGSIEISGIRFTRRGGTAPHIVVQGGGQPALVHDCYFEAGSGSHCLQWNTNGGVIWNCEFVVNPPADAGGIQFKNSQSDSAWRTGPTIGALDRDGRQNTYVEDCKFVSLYLQAMDFDDNSKTVVRHCTFENAAVGSHGQETSPVGARQWELYENTFVFTASPSPYPLNLNYWFFVRGGTGVIWKNVMPDIQSQMWGNKAEIKFNIYNIRRRGQVPCQTRYPAARQIGFGSNNGGVQVSEPVYLWGNSGGGNYDNPSIEDYDPDECGRNQHTADYFKKGRDFFTNTARPDYSPYTYPHPLRGRAPIRKE